MTQGTHHTPHGNGGRSESPRPSQRGTIHLVQTPDAANKCVTSMLSASYNNMQPTTRLRPVQLSIVVSRQYQGRSPRAFHGCHRIAHTSVSDASAACSCNHTRTWPRHHGYRPNHRTKARNGHDACRQAVHRGRRPHMVRGVPLHKIRTTPTYPFQRRVRLELQE